MKNTAEMTVKNGFVKRSGLLCGNTDTDRRHCNFAFRSGLNRASSHNALDAQVGRRGSGNQEGYESSQRNRGNER